MKAFLVVVCVVFLCILSVESRHVTKVRSSIGLPQYQYKYASEDFMSPLEADVQTTAINYIGQYRAHFTQLFPHNFAANVGNTHGQDFARAARYYARLAADLGLGFFDAEYINATGEDPFATLKADVCNMDFRHPALVAHGNYASTRVNIGRSGDLAADHSVKSGFCATNVTVFGIVGQDANSIVGAIEDSGIYSYIAANENFNNLYSSCVSGTSPQVGYFCVFIFADVRPVLTFNDNTLTIQQAFPPIGGCTSCCGSAACTPVTYTSTY